MILEIKKRLFLVAIFLGSLSGLQGQSLLNISENGDCISAFNIGTDTIVGPTTAPTGFGKVLEISGMPPKSLYSFTKEHHTVWYEFEALHTGTLTFDLVPENASNDYDFLLFKGTAAHLCNEIKKGTLKPIRSNISRFSPEIESKTGLSLTATAEFVPSGPGDDYSKSLSVEKSERFLLAVDNVYKNGEGHSIYFYYHNIKLGNQVVSTSTKQPKEDKEKTPLIEIKEAQQAESEKAQKKAIIHLYDKPNVEGNTTARVRKKLPVKGTITGKAKEGIKAVITCRDRKTGELLASTSTENGKYEINIPVIKGIKEYRLEIFADGHFFTDTLFSLRNLTKVAQEGIFRELQPLEVGTTFRINNINFYGDSPEPLPESIYVYQNIQQIMQAYENMEIRVEGHTNGCYGGIESSTRLSIARAESVKNYLSKNGISADRVEIKGWGCSKMLYPFPEDESQSRLNRRVEIKILAL